MKNPTAEEFQIIQEEIATLQRLQGNYQLKASIDSREMLLKQITDINESIPDVNADDLPQISAQLKQLDALMSQSDKMDNSDIDLMNPYFAHMRVKDNSGVRDLYLGTQVFRMSDNSIQIIDWKSSPISLIYFLYEEGDEYEEEIEGRWFEGVLEFKRVLKILNGEVVRIQTGNTVLLKNSDLTWQRMDSFHHFLRGGAGTASRPENTKTVNPQLGMDRKGEMRKDKLLPEITALIDPDQFNLITQPETGIVAIQGNAGSGKTTVALHRVAWLHFRDRKRFASQRLLIMVFNKALANYISKVLPSLGVENIDIHVFETWVAKKRKANMTVQLPKYYSENTPVSVIRFKKHPALLKLINDHIVSKEKDFYSHLNEIIASKKVKNFPMQELRSTPLISTLYSLQDWLDGKKNFLSKTKELNIELKSRIARLLKQYFNPNKKPLETVIQFWEEFFSDFETLKMGFLKLTDDLDESSLNEVIEWLKLQYMLRERDDVRHIRDLTEVFSNAGRNIEHDAFLDYEDDPILLYFHQMFYKRLKNNAHKKTYSHLMVDEVQDFSPIELAVMLNVVEKPYSLTLAGDTNQKMVRYSGFQTWEGTFSNLGIKGQKLSALRVGYRSTFEIMEFAITVLGDLADNKEFIATRNGPPVELFQFSNQGELIQFLSGSLKKLATTEPLASVAIICFSPQEAISYFQLLDKMEITNLRLINDQDFPFVPGIDVTDVKQIKGLEFDYVIMLDVDRMNYPVDTYSRYLLHIASSRAAHQLWLMNYRQPSLLLPEPVIQKAIY